MKIKNLSLAVVLVIAWNPCFGGSKAATVPKYKFQNIAHLSCKQAWIESDRSVDRAFSMIETMTVYLLKQRQQQFPDNRDDGVKFGKLIDNNCKANPDQLMLSAVDSALREVVKP